MSRENYRHLRKKPGCWDKVGTYNGGFDMGGNIRVKDWSIIWRC